MTIKRGRHMEREREKRDKENHGESIGDEDEKGLREEDEEGERDKDEERMNVIKVKIKKDAERCR